MFFDAHLHLIYPDRLTYPWLTSVPALNRPAPIEDYLPRARRLGITGALHMEVDVAAAEIRDETALIRDLMGAHPILKGAISACRPEEADFPDFLDWALEQPEIKGFRRVLHVVPDDLSTDPTFRDNLRRLSGTGRTFDIVVRADQLPLAAALADHCPEVTFVLDHFGNPDVATGGFDPWARALTEIARRDNVHLKISGILANVDAATWVPDDIRPYFDHAAQVFGPARLIWGSDRPVCNLGGGLETWVALTHWLTRDWTAEDRDRLYQGNARALWHL